MISNELRVRFERLNYLWDEIDDRLCDMELPCAISVPGGEGEDDERWRLAYRKYKGIWQIGIDRSGRVFRPLRGCSIQLRTQAASYIGDLIVAAKQAKANVARDVETAIGHLEEFLAADQRPERLHSLEDI